MRILYLPHDLSDPATRNRVRTLRAGGADLVVAGFHRTPDPPSDIEGCGSIALGRTHDARLVQRAASVARVCAFAARRLLREAGRVDAIVARNLEMLAIGTRLARRMRPRPRLVYECLDVHRTLLAPGAGGRALRALEERLLGTADLVIVSSPAFVTHHLARIGRLPPVLLVENKVMAAESGLLAPRRSPPGPPWRIGWFGAIRCAKSLALLSNLAARYRGAVEVVIRGRPSETAIPGFCGRVALAPNVRFEGAYRNPEDLGAIYSTVHFAWAVDFFEEGANSEWLLPNRLYEGCLNGAVPIAVARTETGRFLAARNVGRLLGQDIGGDLSRLFATVTQTSWAADQAGLASLPRGTWLRTDAECRSLVSRIAGVGGGRAAA